VFAAGIDLAMVVKGLEAMKIVTGRFRGRRGQTSPF
jgi:hypothetical protein